MAERQMVRILTVEDDARDARLLQLAMDESKPWCEITRADNGAEALDMLLHRGKYTHQRRPDLILLDLNLPILTGFELLNALKADRELNRIPVLVLSTSRNPGDVEASYKLGAACYIVKPLIFTDWIDMANVLRSFWFDSVTLPKHLEPSPS